MNIDDKDLLEIRSRYEELSKETSNRFNNLLFTISSGALTLSITFIDKTATPTSLILLAWGWGFLIATILCLLLCDLFAFFTSKAWIKVIDTPRQKNIGKGISWLNKINDFLNLLALLSLVVGISCLATYSYKNIENSANSKNSLIELNVQIQELKKEIQIFGIINQKIDITNQQIILATSNLSAEMLELKKFYENKNKELEELMVDLKKQH